MTGGRFKADTDQLDTSAAQWGMASGDLQPGPPPYPGDGQTPTSLATFAIHGTTQMSGQQLMEMLQSYSGKTAKTSSDIKAQEEMSTSSMKDLMNLFTSSAKDGMGIVTNAGQTVAQTFTQTGVALTQAGTTGMTAAVSASVAAMPKAGAGGTVSGGLTNPDNISHHDNTTTTQDGKDGRDTHSTSNARI